MDHQAAPVSLTLLRPDGTPARILVVDDEPDAEYVISTVLRRQGWLVRSAVDGASAVAQADRFRPDAVVLDVLLPDIDGLEAARRIRAFLPDVCVLFLTACDVLDAGIPAGDACLIKPAALEDIIARLRSLLRQAGMTWPASGSDPVASRLTVADLVMNETTREVTRGGKPIDLTPSEFALLRFLMRHPGRVHSAAQILDHVRSLDFGDRSHIVALSVGYLRRKIDTGREPLLHTVPGPGYLLRPDLP
ncbi:response regulator transcription factor [Streptomyces sp. NPDC001286]